MNTRTDVRSRPTSGSSAIMSEIPNGNKYMAKVQIYEGTPEQLVKQLRKLPNTRKYKMTVAPGEPELNTTQRKMITFGMFPQLQALTEEDFKSAEWRGEDIAI